MSMTAQRTIPEYLRKARLKAGCANRGAATLKVHYSPETIGRHERGEVQIEPEDAVQYADGYQSPDILLHYCSDCPVGQRTGKRATVRSLPFATLRVCHMIDNAQFVADKLEKIAFDGEISEKEFEDFKKALGFLQKLNETITDMTLIGMSLGIQMKTK